MILSNLSVSAGLAGMKSIGKTLDESDFIDIDSFLNENEDGTITHRVMCFPNPKTLTDEEKKIDAYLELYVKVDSKTDLIKEVDLENADLYYDGNVKRGVNIYLMSHYRKDIENGTMKWD